LARAILRVSPTSGNADSHMTRRGVERKRPSHIWELILAELLVAMRLMGISRLAELAHRSGGALDGATSALIAELEAGTWRSMAEIADFFPAAMIDGIKVRISMDGGYRVDLLADCEAQMIFIEYAGARIGVRAGKTGSNVA
jgi:hypothetical protein